MHRKDRIIIGEERNEKKRRLNVYAITDKGIKPVGEDLRKGGKRGKAKIRGAALVVEVLTGIVVLPVRY